jgi:hypothetical protein
MGQAEQKNEHAGTEGSVIRSGYSVLPSPAFRTLILWSVRNCLCTVSQSIDVVFSLLLLVWWWV